MKVIYLVQKVEDRSCGPLVTEQHEFDSVFDAILLHREKVKQDENRVYTDWRIIVDYD